MDTSWMYFAPRTSQTVVNGVSTFLNVAFERCVNGDTIKCPCIHYLNMKFQSRQIVLDHVICLGFQPEYLKWVYHGEDTTTTLMSTTLNEEEVLHHEMNENFLPEGGSGEEIHENTYSNSQETDNRGSNFDYLVKEAEENVYLNCKWSNKSLSMLLEFMKDLLPEGNVLPKTTQQVKKIMANMGLGYEKIHACPNGCMLFWDNKEKDETSKIVYVIKDIKPYEVASYRVCERWKLRHPADALVWKYFDEKFPEFASDPRNVRLALQPNLILSLIILGPKGPGNKIDVYMRPLIKELKELWEYGVNKFDASTKQYFQLKVSIISTISDFPGYANLSGWSTKEELACPRKLIGMKSYNCHMLMQEYLPIALCGTLPNHVSSVIIELCDFFKTICYKDLSEVDLHFLESKVALTLCELKKIFPPSFFTVMVHLVIHLTREVKLGGPVAFRWMYPIER
ncbi:uncharacterized protein LOC143559403 [Bidens hawaiensis]|uniref:uncharacterized protein LOC143559403 n=1 Tax=Bidens hawaiensis TaxID=980011 RepID=UPI00404AE2B0